MFVGRGSFADRSHLCRKIEKLRALATGIAALSFAHLLNCSGVKEITLAASVKLYFECGCEIALHALVMTDW